MAKVSFNTEKAVQNIQSFIISVKEMKAAGGAATKSLAADLSFLEAELETINKTGVTTTQTFNKMEQAAKRLNITTTNSIGAYRKLQIEYSKAVAHAKNMATLYGKMDARARTAAASAKKLGNRLNEINRTTKKVSKGMMAFNTGMSKLMGTMALFVGLQTFVELTKNVYNLLKQLDAMRFAMEAVITDQFELAQTTEWLKEITNSYGVDLVATTERYVKFRAAAGQANLTMRETQDIFETMTKVSGVLGLSTDELKGVYLALEQMISKGKVTTEELRRQLGERLPGAVDILAKSMGVTTDKLSEMMKKGEVITKDVLPAFAEEVEKTFGLDSVNKVETLIAAEARLENAWIDFVNTVNGSDGVISEWVRKGLDDLSEYMNFISDKFFKGNEQWFDSSQAIGYKEAIQDIEKELELYAETAGELSQEQKNQLVASNLSEYAAEWQKATDNVNSAKLAIKNLSHEGEKGAFLETAKEMVDTYGTMHSEDWKAKEEERLTQQMKEQGYWKGKIEAAKEYFKTVTAIDEVEIEEEDKKKKKIDTSELDLRISQSKRLIEIEETIADDQNRVLEARLEAENKAYNEGLVLLELQYLKRIKLADGHAGKIAVIEQEYRFDKIRLAEKSAETEIKIKEDELKRVRDLQEKLTEEQLDLETKYYEDLSELRRNFAGEELAEKEQALTLEFDKAVITKSIAYLTSIANTMDKAGVSSKALRAEIAGLQAELDGLGNGDEGFSFKDKLIAGLELAGEAVGHLGDLAQAVFDRRIEMINAEIEAEEEKYDRWIAAAENNKDEQVRLEEEKAARIKILEAERLKEEQKAAKYRKAQAVVEIAINTAIATMRAYSDTGPIGGTVFAAIIAALGAVQIATVLAQPIPQYRMGLDRAKDDHIAMINDGVKGGKMVQEYIERDGNILTTSTKNAIVGLQKGDKVHKDYDSMINSDAGSILKATTMANLESKASGRDINIVLDEQLGGLKRDINKGIKTGFRDVTLIAKAEFDFDFEKFKRDIL